MMEVIRMSATGDSTTNLLIEFTSGLGFRSTHIAPPTQPKRLAHFNLSRCLGQSQECNRPTCPGPSRQQTHWPSVLHRPKAIRGPLVLTCFSGGQAVLSGKPPRRWVKVPDSETCFPRMTLGMLVKTQGRTRCKEKRPF